MKLIEPKVELYPQESYSLEGIYKQIEKCARVSYKSEDKITDTSSKKFVDNLIKAGHGAALEHGTVYLKWHAPGIYDRVKGHTVYDYVNNPYSKSTECLTEKSILQATTEYRITTNYRVLIENDWLDDLKYLCEPTEFHEKRYSVKFTTDIGTAREFTRHRVFSLVQESTRYCNYSKSKFDNEVTFICPKHIDYNEAVQYGQFHIKDRSKTPESNFISNLNNAERDYIYLIKEGWKPQEARQVLPLATKTELVMTGFESDWRHFFDLRLRGTTGAPHPDAKRAAQMAWDLLKETYNIEL